MHTIRRKACKPLSAQRCYCAFPLISRICDGCTRSLLYFVQRSCCCLEVRQFYCPSGMLGLSSRTVCTNQTLYTTTPPSKACTCLTSWSRKKMALPPIPEFPKFKPQSALPRGREVEVQGVYGAQLTGTGYPYYSWVPAHRKCVFTLHPRKPNVAIVEGMASTVLQCSSSSQD